MQWTDVTEALAAVVGAVATPSAVLIGVRSLKLQQAQADAESQRMKLKSVKAVVLDAVVRDWPTIQGGEMYETLVATVVNHGDEAVFDVALEWRRQSTDFAESSFKGVLSPGEQWEFPAPNSLVRLGPFDEASVFVTFFDADSTGWAKTQRGDFVRLRDAIFEGW